MTSVKVFPPPSDASRYDRGGQNLPSSLPQLLQTPAGLALIEIQGTINHPETLGADGKNIQIGRLEFPDYRHSDFPPGHDGRGKWQKRVWLYVGEHQRLTGEVKKLPKPLGVLRKRSQNELDPRNASMQSEEDLEIAEVINWKIVFSSRPEPVGVSTEV